MYVKLAVDIIIKMLYNYIVERKRSIYRFAVSLHPWLRKREFSLHKTEQNPYLAVEEY